MQKITWEISKEERQTPWALVGIISAASVGVAVYFFTVQNYFASAFFGLAPVIFLVLVTQGPRITRYEVNEKGIRVNSTEHSYKRFKYYSFIDDFLVLKPKKNEPTVYVPVPEEKAGSIESLVAGKLEEGEHEESLGEIINRIFHIY